jgi:hypothetical protein
MISIFLTPTEIILEPLDIVLPKIFPGLNFDESHVTRTDIFNPVNGPLGNINSLPFF